MRLKKEKMTEIIFGSFDGTKLNFECLIRSSHSFGQN